MAHRAIKGDECLTGWNGSGDLAREKNFIFRILEAGPH